MLGFLRYAALALLAVFMALPADARVPSDWVLLGEQDVGFRVDRDTIDVGREGVRFSQLRIEAERNDVHLISLRLIYQNGYAEEFRVDRTIRAGTEALPVDLRGERSYLRKIELLYRSQPNFRGRAVVRVYGELRGRGRPDIAGGERFEVIDSKEIRRRDRDRIVFDLPGRRGDSYTKLRFQARNGGIRVEDVQITFGNGRTQRVSMDDRLGDNELSRIIDLDGDQRAIEGVRVEARPVRGERSATLVLLGVKAEPPRRRRPDLGAFKPLDRQRITRRTDDGYVEFDVGRDEGRFSELRFLAEDGDVFVREATIIFGNGQTQSVRVRDRLDENDLSDVIDLAGESRAIRTVKLRARLARGERDATLVLLAKEDQNRRGWGRGPGREEWVTLGRQRAALFKTDTDTFRVGRELGTFRAIRAVVTGPDVRFYSMTIKYGNGSVEEVPLVGTIRGGQASQAYDLKGRDRFIESITFRYRSKISLRGSGSIELQGLKHGPYRGR